MDFYEAAAMARTIRSMLGQTILAASHAGISTHEAWHQLPQEYQQEDLNVRSTQIYMILIPAYRGQPDWEYLIDDLEKISTYLRFFVQGPIYGCPYCY